MRCSQRPRCKNSRSNPGRQDFPSARGPAAHARTSAFRGGRVFRLRMVWWFGLAAVAVSAFGAGGGALQEAWWTHMPLAHLASEGERPDASPDLVVVAATRLLDAGRAERVRVLLAMRPDLESLPEVQILLSRTDLELGRIREALARARVALMLAPDDPDAHWQLFAALRADRREGDAAQQEQWLLHNAPQHPGLHLRRADAELASGDHRRALRTVEGTVQRRFPGEAALVRARALQGLSRYPAAEAAAREAIRHSSAAEPRRFLARLLAQQPEVNRRQEAIRWLEPLARASDQPEIWRELGLLYLQNGRPREAARALRAHIAQDSTSVRSYPPLARAYHSLGHAGAAERVLAIYRRLAPIESRTAQAEYDVVARRGAPEARVRLAGVYAACGLEDRARAELTGVLRTHPGHTTARTLLGRLPTSRSLHIPPLPPDPDDPGSRR